MAGVTGSWTNWKTETKLKQLDDISITTLITFGNILPCTVPAHSKNAMASHVLHNHMLSLHLYLCLLQQINKDEAFLLIQFF